MGGGVMEKWTPGPWQPYFSSVRPECWPGIQSYDLSLVVWGDPIDPDDWEGVRGHTREEAMANAQLMATAPRLYYALKGLLESEQCDATDAAIEEASEALAQARGE